MEQIGSVFFEVDKQKGLCFQWRGERPGLKNGDRLVVKFRDAEVLSLFIGSAADINDPVACEWLPGKIMPEPGEALKCDVYKR